MSGWGVFATVTGSATAALLGLLFVAVSIRVEAITHSKELVNRAAQTMALLLGGLLTATLLAVPGQHDWTLGVEYVALALVVITVARVLDRRAGTKRGTALGHLLDSFNPTLVTCLLLVVAGIILILGDDDGTYFVVPALVAVLAGGVVNAWLLLVRLPDAPGR
jgi:hypothetical protein